MLAFRRGNPRTLEGAEPARQPGLAEERSFGGVLHEVDAAQEKQEQAPVELVDRFVVEALAITPGAYALAAGVDTSVA
jgi:hypothetical protein